MRVDVFHRFFHRGQFPAVKDRILLQIGEQSIDPQRGLGGGFYFFVREKVNGVPDQIADHDRVGIADQTAVGVQQMLTDLVGVGALKMNEHKLHFV